MPTRYWKRILLNFGVIGLLAAAYERIETPATMADAAHAYLASLPSELKERAQMPFAGDERLNWHFIPLDNRKGVALREMPTSSKHLAYTLLSAGLSAQGVIKAHTIMSLEQILKDQEKAKGGGLERDPEKYFVSVFGEPGPKGAWGYRFEGHHVSLNFTVVDGKVIGSSPNFFGANPAKVLDGPRAGLRALKREEDLAFQLMDALTAEQKTTAIFAAKALPDIVTGDARKAALNGQPNGLPFSKLTTKQKEILTELIAEYATNFPPVIADFRMDQYKKTQNQLFFAWAGGTAHTDPYYYRIQTPAFLIEHDKTQDRGNHIHSVWRDFAGDFGLDLLAQHYQADHR